jgi:hypothetical protein
VISVGLVPLVLNLQRLPATDHSQLGQQREGIKDILLLGIHNKSLLQNQVVYSLQTLLSKTPQSKTKHKHNLNLCKEGIE